MKAAEGAPDFMQIIQLQVVPDKDGKLIFPQERDPNIIMARRNYKRTPILMDAGLKGILDDVLTHQNTDWFVQILLWSSRTFTRGTTSAYPPFAPYNFLRDQISSWFLSRNKMIPIYSALKTLVNYLKDKEGPEARFAEEYMALGGEKQTLVGFYDLAPDEALKAMLLLGSGLRGAVGLAVAAAA